jgi:hypothetical protein
MRMKSIMKNDRKWFNGYMNAIERMQQTVFCDGLMQGAE